MTKLQENPINAVLHSESTKEKVKKAQNRFRFKPFFEKYAGLQVTANVLQYLLPVLSIGTGTLFLANVLSQVLPVFYLAVCLAIGLIIALEYTKAYLLNLSFTDFYAHKANITAFLFCLVLACLSAFVSLQGIRELHKSIDTSLQDIAQSQSIQTDSLSTYYDKQIEATKQALTDFKASITWQGKINMHNPSNAQILTEYSRQVSYLQQEKAKALTAIGKMHEQQSQAIEQATGFSLSVVIGVIALVEVCILLANWFVVYYDYQTAKQSELLSKGNQSVLIDLDNFQSSILGFLQTTALNPEHLTYPTSQNKPFAIGFQTNKEAINTDTQNKPEIGQNTGIDISIDTLPKQDTKQPESPQISLKDKAFLEAYAPIVTDLQRGKSYGSILKTEYDITDLRTQRQVTKRISKTTLQNINRVLNNL